MEPIHVNGQWFALEPVWHKDLVLLVVIAVREDVGALQRLVEVAEDVEDDHNGLGSVVRTSDIYTHQSVSVEHRGRTRRRRTRLVATDILIRTFGLVALGHNGRDVAARGGVAVGGRHGRHGGRFRREELLLMVLLVCGELGSCGWWSVDEVGGGCS